MTNEQAIIHFKEQLEVFGGEHHEAMKVAIEALEKQIPKKPLGGVDFEGNAYLICKECSAVVIDGDWRADYCPNCGAKMDGGDKE